MTPMQFNQLTENDQENVVLDKGSFIGLRQEPEFIIRLYQLGSFYVELFYHRVRKKPVCIRSFTDMNKLDPYISGIDLGFI